MRSVKMMFPIILIGTGIFNGIGSTVDHVTLFKMLLLKLLPLALIHGHLTNTNLACFYGAKANNADPDQTPHDAMSDQDLHCKLTNVLSKSVKKYEKYYPTAHRSEMDWPNS